ncbi:hypothetical protein [Pararhodobacter sp.]|uniref:hypothetical protein n=1 Tax=Pararhodobacter sp. TaxID=2127056 RepID=UPI002AFEDF36|nr:hypothetical protein [Pararhodobacter sp.]
MDAMQGDLNGMMSVVATMLLAAAVVLACVALWLGHRRVRAGDLRRALWTLSALIGLNAWLAVMAFLADTRFVDNPAQWIMGGFGGPALAGYALGCSLGLLRTRG